MSDGQIAQLRQSVRWIWVALLAVTVALAADALRDAVSLSDELTLKRLTIVDDEGKERFEIGTLPDGEAHLVGYDDKGNPRFGLRTLPDGTAQFAAFNSNGEAVWSKYAPD